MIVRRRKLAHDQLGVERDTKDLAECREHPDQRLMIERNPVRPIVPPLLQPSRRKRFQRLRTQIQFPFLTSWTSCLLFFLNAGTTAFLLLACNCAAFALA